MNLPLLPTPAILCPKGRIPLQIYEPRYLDMLSRILKAESDFVIVMLRSDDQEDSFYKVGTRARVVDFGALTEEGWLTITAEGVSQVKLSNVTRQDDGLWLADTSEQHSGDYVDLPEKYDELKLVLRALVKHPYVKDLNMDIDYQDCREIGWRLTELLPFERQQKQCLYEMNDALYRLETITKQLSEMVE